MSEQKPMINVGGLWENTSKNGGVYLSGNLGGLKILVFPNDKRGNDRAPDWRVCLTEREREEQPAPGPSPQPQRPAQRPAPVTGRATVVDDGDIPF